MLLTHSEDAHLTIPLPSSGLPGAFRALKEKPGPSIIMACYRPGSLIEDALRSVMAHNVSQRSLDIIIPDDHSCHEETRVSLEKIKRQYGAQVQVIELPENRGPAFARNVALRHAKHPTVLFVDSDDLLDNDPERLRNKGSYYDRAVAMLEDPDTAMVYCGGRMFAHEAGAREGPMCEHLSSGDESALLVAKAAPVFGVFRRDELLKIGGFNESLPYSEDWCLALTLLNSRLMTEQERKIGFINDEYYLYRQYAHNNHVDGKPKDYEKLFTALYQSATDLYRHHMPELSECPMEAGR